MLSWLFYKWRSRLKQKVWTSGVNIFLEHVCLIQRWTNSCVYCVQKKHSFHYSELPVLSLAVSNPWEVIAADCMGPLPKTNLEYCYILIGWTLYEVYWNCYPAVIWNHINCPSVIGQTCILAWSSPQIINTSQSKTYIQTNGTTL